MSKGTNRGSFLGQAVMGAAGVGAACSLDERILLAALEEDSDADSQQPPARPLDAPAEFPTGQIGDLKISRMLLGGNLIGGWAHSRDLLYVSPLFKAHNTPAKIFETLELASKEFERNKSRSTRQWYA